VTPPTPPNGTQAPRPAPHLHLEGLLAPLHGVVVEGELVLADDGPAVLVPGVGDDVEGRGPHLELPLPVDDGGERGADEERALGVALGDSASQGETGTGSFGDTGTGG